MDIVFAHTDDLVVPLLIEWLEFVDVVRFDMACATSKQERENLDRVFSLPQTAFDDSKHLFSGFNRDMKQYLNWLLRKKVKLVDLVVTSAVAAEAVLVEKYLNLCGAAVLSLDFNVYNTKIFSTAMESCSHIKKLSIDDGSDIAEDSVLVSNSLETFYMNCETRHMKKNISTKFPNLKDLTLVGCYINDGTFVGIMQHSPQLQRLQFDDATALTAASFAAIGQYCRSLERLFVYDMPFSSALLVDILPFTPQLTELILCHTGDSTDELEVFEAVEANCPALTELSLNTCASLPRPIVLSAFTSMLTRCPHLRTLTLESCDFVTDDYLLAIATNATQIVNLHLPECHVSNGGLAQVAKHCAQLECVSVSTGEEYDVTDDCKLLFQPHMNVSVTNTDMAGGNVFNGDFAFNVGNGFGFGFGGGFDAAGDGESDEEN